VIATPRLVDAWMKKVPKGRVTTINEIRAALAEDHGADIACPITTGIFAAIAAHVAQENRAAGKKIVTPYWRTLRAGGAVNPKYPGGIEAQKKLLEAEGLKVLVKGQKAKVIDFKAGFTPSAASRMDPWKSSSNPMPKRPAAWPLDSIAKLIREKSRAVLGFATGQTPLPLYRELCRLHREEKLDFDRVTSFNLDEYVGLNPAHPASFRTYMWTHLFGQINIVPEHVHIPDGLAPNIPISCEKYEDEIQAAGGIDLQILGIGTDGHIGFNEPSSSLASRTRIKTLTARTRRDNAGAFAARIKCLPMSSPWDWRRSWNAGRASCWLSALPRRRP